jgi:hypothetical protein
LALLLQGDRRIPTSAKSRYDNMEKRFASAARIARLIEGS